MIPPNAHDWRVARIFSLSSSDPTAARIEPLATPSRLSPSHQGGMMSEKPIHIISVNVGCRSSAQYAVLSETLNHPLSYGIVFLQEPWWFNVGETSQPRSVAMNGWEPIPPQNPPPQNVTPRVHAYLRRNLNIKFTTRTDIINSPDIQIIDVTTNTATPKTIRFINIYKGVLGRPENPEINKLFSMDVDQTIPTIYVGDWNVHHPSIGNMPPYAPNPNGAAIEWDAWMRDNSLTLRNLPDTPTRFDPISGRGYALDLTIVNNPAIQERLVDNWEITDKLNGDSDHLATSFRLNTTPPTDLQRTSIFHQLEEGLKNQIHPNTPGNQRRTTSGV